MSNAPIGERAVTVFLVAILTVAVLSAGGIVAYCLYRLT